MYKPTKAEVLAAAGKTVPDVIAPNLRILFCGINPGLYTAAVGHHFGRPGNRFWKALHISGITERLLHPSEQLSLLEGGYGITNIVERPTATAAELSPAEFVEGGHNLEKKVLQYSPRYLAILGIDAYRKSFNRPKTKAGIQTETIGNTSIWVLPNPSGLNAHYHLEAIVELFRELRLAAENCT